MFTTDFLLFEFVPVPFVIQFSPRSKFVTKCNVGGVVGGCKKKWKIKLIFTVNLHC